MRAWSCLLRKHWRVLILILLAKAFITNLGYRSLLVLKKHQWGGWFHKIGVGLLQKETTPYFFAHDYKIKPAEFEFTANSDKIAILCNSASTNGYAYSLSKEIALIEKGGYY